MYRIIATNPDGSELTIYDPVGTGALPVLGPRATEELNEAGSLEFALVYGHEAWEQLSPKKTYISAELDGKEIFYGRVLNADPSPLTGQIQYMCAGALSFLQDSEVPPDPKKSDGTTNYQTMTAEAFFRRCIAAHNADIGNDPRRTFTVGTVSHSRKDETREYQISSYSDTKSTIDQQLISYYGGFLRVRRDNGTLYIDWVEQYGDTDQGTLELGRNIISLLNRMTGEELYTTIRPVGADGIVLSGNQTIDIFPSAEMAEYGKIVRNMQFPDAKTEADLRTKAEALVSKIQKTVLISSEISLVDMIFTDEDSHGVNLGDVYNHIAGLDGTPMTVGARNRDFENPQNDSCTLKNSKSFEGNLNGESRNSGTSLSKRSSRNSSAAGYSYKYIHEFQDRLELNAKEISINAEQLELHADMFIETANEFARISHVEGEMQNELNIIEGTGVFQNSEHITNIAGQFQYDPVTHAVELVDGTEFKIHSQDGAMITVGTRLTDLTEKDAEFRGSALWTQRDNITGVSGEFEVKYIDGKRTLVIKSGGGIKIRRDNTEFGLYDEGSLTGGIIVQKVNDGTMTLIRGDIIDLSSNSAFASLVIDKNGLQQTVRDHSQTISMHTESINGVAATVTTMTGSALWTQRDNITGVTGEFDIVTIDGKRTIRVKSGGGMVIRRDNADFGLWDKGNLTGGIMVEKLNDGSFVTKIRGDIINLEANNGYTQLVADKNGLQQTVRDQGTAIGTHTEMINGVIQSVQTIQGSALWTQKDNITGVCGQFDVITDTATGKKTIRVISGGGLKIMRNNTEFGVYDNGSLTAGIICNKINGGTTIIEAKNVAITGNTTIKDCFMVDGYGIHALRNFYGTHAEFSSGINTTGVSFTGYGNTTYYMPASTVAAMIKTAELDGTTLRLTRFDGTTLDFSSATSLSGAWSGSTYTVTASPQGARNSVAIVSRLNGTAQYSNFSAEFGTSDGSGNFIKHGESRGYLIENVSGKYVDVSTAASGGSTVARISTTATYNAGNSAGYNTGYNAGYNNAKPVSGTAGGRSYGVSALVHDFTIRKGDGGTVTLQIDVSGIYSTARSGYYTQQQYNNYGTSRYNSGYSDGNTAGYNNAKPVSGTAGGRTSGTSALVHDFTIRKGDGGTVTLQIDVSGIYSTARSGYYTADQYNSYGTSRYNSGYNNAKPVSGTAGGRSYGVSALVHDFTIRKGDGGTVTLQIDVSGIYSTARSGYYTYDQYVSYGTSRYNSGYSDGNTAGQSYAYSKVSVVYDENRRCVPVKENGEWTGNMGVDVGSMLDSSYNSGYSAGNTAGYNSGYSNGKNAVTLSSPYANAVTTLSAVRTFYVDTAGRDAKLTEEVPLHLHAGSWSSGTTYVYLKWGASTGSTGTDYARISVNMPSSVSIGTVKNSNTGTKHSYVATKKVHKNYKYNWLPITIGGKEYVIRIEM